jgi:radical SAM protein with 4Fe4S-binding SPASM domain
MGGSAKTILRARKPTLTDERGDRHLLVWGELATWMVVDSELRSFLELFNGKRSLRRVLEQHARRTRRTVKEVEREAGPVVQHLLERRLLSAPGKDDVAPVEPEPVGIANVTINTTNRCNLRCSFCYNAERATGELPISQIMDALDDARAGAVLEEDASFIILGGEPTLDLPRLLEAIDRSAALFRPAPLVSTNGTLLTAETVAELAARRVDVQVSLDSPLARRHDAVRGRGVFEKAVAGVRRLVAAGVPTTLSMVYTRENVAEIEPYLDLALALGVDEARFIPMRLIGRGGAHGALCPDQAATFDHLVEILERRPELRRLLLRDYFSILLTILRFSSPRTGCGIGRKVVFIDADGTVYPCPNHTRPEHACGNLRDAGLKQIIESSPVMNAVRERYQVTRYTRCRSCPFRYWCAGDCRGEALLAGDDPFAPSPHCEELRRTYTRMLWLIADGATSLGSSRNLGDGRRVEDLFRV